MVHRRNGAESVFPNVTVGLLKLEHAQREEQRAKDQRLGAQVGLMDAFETAGYDLVALCKSGDCSPQEILQLEARLRALDPSRDSKEPDPTWISDRFDLLTDGQPAYDLHLEGGSRYSGIVKGEPFDFRVVAPKSRESGVTLTNLYTAYTRFNIALYITDYMREQTAELSGLTLRYGLIGREAIAKAASDAKFENNTGILAHRLSPETNYSELTSLREFISQMFEEGVESFDTTPLDEAIVEANEYRQVRYRSSRPAMLFPYGPLGLSPSPLKKSS